MIELDVALPNGLVFLMDVASGQVPEWSESPVFSTGSCIAVKALHGQEGNVRIVLERVSTQGADPCTFEAVLDAPRGVLNLVNVDNEVLTEVPVGRDRFVRRSGSTTCSLPRRSASSFRSRDALPRADQARRAEGECRSPSWSPSPFGC